MIPRAPFVLLLSVGWWCIDGLAVCAQVAPIAPAPPTSSSATSPDAPGLQVGTDVVGRVSSTPAHAFQRANPGGDFRERYALAKDRRAVLDELIPGTDDYYYYHCLYFQTTGQLDQAAAVLAQWRTARGDIPAVRNMLTRQLLLSYPQNPRQALDFIRNELHLKLDHAPPSNDENVELPSQLDLAAVTPAREILQQLAHDPTLATFEDRTLPKLLRHQLTPRQLRALLSRLTRADVPGVVERIAEELELRDSRGFGWARVHDLLTAEQLDQLQRLRPSLLENERFLRARAARLVPPEGVAWDDPTVRGPYLERLVAWTRTLPPSQNSLKALTLGRLLEFQVSQGKYDRQLFLDYLALPRPQVYYRNERIRQQSREVADLNFSMQPEIPLPPIGDDIGLVRRLLEHFLRTADTVDVFAPYVDRDYLERVWAETKLLYGVGDPATWYPKLGPAEQQALRNRIELRFAPDNPLRFAIDEPVALKVELKNIPELTVRVYHIDALAYFRQHHQPVPIDVDLDGLAPNATWRQQFDILAHRRHEFRIDLSDHTVGAGVWIVDVFGSDQRARALIRKGTLTAVDRLGDAGHVFRVFDESGAPVADATIELAGNLYRAQGGEILIPYAAEEQTRSIIVRHGEVATIQSFHHRAEKYSLALRLLADRQGIVSGQQATLLIRPRVLCHEQPIDIRLLEEPQLSIRVSQADGMVSTLQPTAVQLSDTGEITHRLLIPARARQITVLLRGRVYNRSADRHEPVEGEATILCNQREDSLHIASFYWQYTPHGIRVLALGRNGEPAVNLPVQVNVKWEDWKTVQPFSLATDEAGSIQLSHVGNIEYLEVSAQRVGTTRIVPNMVYRPWPSRIHATSDMPIELPLGNADLTLADLSLHELRAGKPYRDAINHLTIEDFAVRIAPLAAGAYRLIDHRTGLGSTIHVVEGPRHGSVLLGSSQIVESSGLPGAIIASAQTDEESLIIRMHQWDAATRIHIVGTPLAPTVDASAIEFPPVSPGEQARNRSRNAWVDSLRVDEEYGYILERHRASKFPGNLLPQPSLLLYPWEVATTENLRRDARVGDAIPSTAEAEARRRGRSSQLRGEAQSAPTDAPTYDFLAHNAIVLENLRPDADGALTLDRQPFRTCSSITIFAVHPWGVDSRRIDQTIASLPTRDRRLTQGFDRGMPMLHVQQVEVLPGGETVKLNEVQSMRRQVYSSLADIMQYFDALGDDGQWSQFSFLQRWHLLEDEARRQLYEAHACHELNLFLYFHDRDFFAAVIRPVLENKLEKQLVDRWLLGQSLEDYRELWRLRRLNALERVLVASRVADLKEGTERYFADWLAANPMPVSEADRRFEIALQRSQLVAGATAGYAGAVGTRGAFGGGEHFGAVPPAPPAPGDSLAENAVAQELDMELATPDAALGAQARGLFFKSDRQSLGRLATPRLFEGLDKTREWGESQYYRVPLAEQTADLIPPGAFWLEVLQNDAQPLLPQSFYLVHDDVHSRLAALAFIDLPLSAAPPKNEAQEGVLSITSPTPALLLSERYVSATVDAAGENAPSLLIGQELYMGGNDTPDQEPLDPRQLVQGVPYVDRIIVSNPSARLVRAEVLVQIPSGAIPLEGGRSTSTVPVELAPYHTQQLEISFYFPAAGSFEQYGAQVSIARRHVVGTPGRQLEVHRQPPLGDERSWEYLADWGQPDAILRYLERGNLLRIDLDRIAFRMKDHAFYNDVLSLLESRGVFVPSLWAYAVHHNDPQRIEQLLQHRPDLVARLGPVFDSPLIQVFPEEQLSFAHLEYRPLVLARTHPLGGERTILNPSLAAQYQRFMEVLAHQQQLTPPQRLQVVYYLLLQNRIEEALNWLDQVDGTKLVPRVQYDYLVAYTDLFRREYAHAAQVARGYTDYPSPRWRELFAQLRAQLAQRQAMLEGRQLTIEERTGLDPAAREFLDQRNVQQEAQAHRAPWIELREEQGSLVVHHRNVDAVDMRFYQMDVEVLFSRRPFASAGDSPRPIIHANYEQTIELDGDEAVPIDIPSSLRNQNLIVEAQAGGVSRRLLLTNSQLAVTLVEPYGRLIVTSRQGRAPVAAAYVKVYARHRDGSVKFYKDGYTDLRGHFDYATLSTNDMDTVEQFAILVLHPELGSMIRQAAPPAR